jgi:hypothetical protein
MTDIYIEILKIVEGDVAKATAIRKIIDEEIINEFQKLLVEYQRKCGKGA